MTSNCLTLEDLKAMPIRGLADIANGTEKGMGVRQKAAGALAARLQEFNGAGWLRASQEDREAIKMAMSFDTAGFIPLEARRD